MYTQYEEREVIRFRREWTALKDLPLSERKENQEQFTEYLTKYLDKVIESVEWIIQGHYGQGAYLDTLRVLKNKRMNRRAWLFNVVAALEYRLEGVRANKVWKSLDKDLQETINNQLDKVINEWEKEG